jgi:endogenous inhibitor of DNA gyrase (YacG/DUF329 family)
MTDPETDPERSGTETPVPARLSAARCPVCGKETAARYRPFCSRRCADVDLSRWFGGGYVVAGHEQVDPEEIADAIAAGETTDPERP